MDLKLYSVERAKRRVVVIILMAALFAYAIWRVFHDGTLSDWKEPEQYLGNLTWIIRALVLPLAATIGMYLLKPWGISFVSLWILFEISAFEMQLAFYGPTFSFPGGWWVISLSFAFFILIGIRDLWDSFLYRALKSKTITPLWVNKAFWALVILFILCAVPSYFVFCGLKTGFSYPELMPLPYEGKVFSPSDLPPLPFGYQLNLPSPLKNIYVYPKEGRVCLKIGKHLWTLESKNDLQDAFQDVTKSKEKFLKERYGIIPRIIKSIPFGGYPDYFYEIKQNGLWGVISIKEMDKRDAAVEVYLWDANGSPLGEISGYAASISKSDWDWVYTLGKTGSSWSPDQYASVAKKYRAEGQKDLAEFCLASAVLVDKEKTSRLKSLIDFLRKNDRIEKAQYELKVALEAFPQDSLLKSMQLPVRLRK